MLEHLELAVPEDAFVRNAPVGLACFAAAAAAAHSGVHGGNAIQLPGFDALMKTLTTRSKRPSSMAIRRRNEAPTGARTIRYGSVR